MGKKAEPAAATPPADETPAERENTDDAAPGTDGSADKGGTVPDQPQTDAAAEPVDGMAVETKAPWFWMKSTTSGNFYPAYDLGTKADLEGGGCVVTNETPEGMPAATGIPAGLRS